MPRPKQRQTLVAEKALKAAIAEETAAVRVELDAANRRIATLEGTLDQIARIAQGAPRATSVPPRLPESVVVMEPEIPSGPEGGLADEDNLGVGRWV